MARTVKKPEQILVKRTENIAINLYAVRNQAGSWFHKNEYNYEASWSKNISSAKIFGTESSAKRQVTHWYTRFPEKGMPDLVLIKSGVCDILEQTERVKKAANKKAIEFANIKIKSLNDTIKRYLDINTSSNKPFNRPQLAKWQEDLLEAKCQLNKIKSL